MPAHTVLRAVKEVVEGKVTIDLASTKNSAGTCRAVNRTRRHRRPLLANNAPLTTLRDAIVTRAAVTKHIRNRNVHRLRDRRPSLPEESVPDSRLQPRELRTTHVVGTWQRPHPRLADHLGVLLPHSRTTSRLTTWIWMISMMRSTACRQSWMTERQLVFSAIAACRSMVDSGDLSHNPTAIYLGPYPFLRVDRPPFKLSLIRL